MRTNRPIPDMTWAEEPHRKRFSSPYGRRENLVWLKNFCFGPGRRHRDLTRFMAQDARLSSVEPRVSMAFIGDVMPTSGGRCVPGSGLREFLEDVDYLVLNLEGVISKDRRVLNGVRHAKSILVFLSELFPVERTVIGCANNHSGDCGWREFRRCYGVLESRGWRVVGRRDEPSVVLEDAVQVTACTLWSNQPCGYVAPLEGHNGEFSADAPFSILFPHWGYEMELHPRPDQIALARELLGEWDLIVGHHSHCPQPITRYGDRCVAYSLGNFCCRSTREQFRYGIIVKVGVGPDYRGKWQIGPVSWRFTRQRARSRRAVEIEVGDTCRLYLAGG
jgi:hypothetical protein